jgi:hypothetical protein
VSAFWLAFWIVIWIAILIISIPFVIVTVLAIWTRYGFSLFLTFSALATVAVLFIGSYLVWQFIYANSGAIYVVLAHVAVLGIAGTIGWFAVK